MSKDSLRPIRALWNCEDEDDRQVTANTSQSRGRNLNNISRHFIASNNTSHENEHPSEMHGNRDRRNIHQCSSAAASSNHQGGSRRSQNSNTSKDHLHSNHQGGSRKSQNYNTSKGHLHGNAKPEQREPKVAAEKSRNIQRNVNVPSISHQGRLQSPRGNTRTKRNTNEEHRRQDSSEGYKSDRNVNPLGFITMKNLIRKETSEIVLTLNRAEFLLLLNIQKLSKDPDFMAYILINLGKAATSHMRNNVTAIMSTVCSHETFLLLAVQTYLASFYLAEIKDIHLESFIGLTEFLHKLQLYLPAIASEKIPALIPLLEKTCKKHLLTNDSYTKVIDLLEEMESENLHYLSQFQNKNQVIKASMMEKMQHSKPPEDYRSIPTLPASEDILQICSFLRPNIVHGKYQDTEHYLDVQYRLLREDYIKPLRDGIAEYKHLKKSKKKMKNCKDVRVYTDVHIMKQELARGGLVHVALFNDQSFKAIRWEYSKRFLTGSLLCLSSDNFQTMLFASVANREPKDLVKGLLLLRFEELTDEVLTISPLRSFDVIETTAYFEAYRYNLSALKELNEERLPMKQYIVDVEKTVQKPRYLNAITTYDMRPLLLPLDATYIKQTDGVNGDTIMTYEFPKNISDRARSITVLNDNNWPSTAELNLDQSQFTALKAAVTKEFAVIQGPPGTGKTYVGLRIAQLLLHNRRKWLSDEKSPILVVCYTNHALDQFLEGLLLFTKNIVRVGGRGSNEALAKYQLNNLKRVIEEKRAVPHHIFHSIKKKNYDLRNVKEQIDRIRRSLERSMTTILSEETLRDCILPDHYDSLKMARQYFEDDGLFIHDWLGTRARAPSWASNSEEFFAPLEPKIVYTKVKTNRVTEVEAEAKGEDESEGEADIEYIEAQRDINSEDFAEVSMDIPKDDTSSLLPDMGDGWQIQGGQKKRKQYIEYWLKHAIPMPEEATLRFLDVFKFNLEERWQLYMYWLQKYCNAKQQDSFELQQQLKKEYEELIEMRTEEDLYVCQTAHVVGMTTTGAAKYRSIVQHLNPRILIVEEAAEILESHIVTSLAPDTQHIILIGDHQQLKPSPTVHLLAVQYGLNVSLFERMVDNGLECHRLGIQHRMRPGIASLLVPHIYSDLRNHESVTTFENVKGVAKNVFFVNHSHCESAEHDSKSKRNEHEANFLYRLARYFILQGYDTSQITILTTYTGQLFAIKKLISGRVEDKEKEGKKRNILTGVKCTVVDNYQGEENDIILISFVRSNEEGEIGFLKIANRVCVALSRAKKGLFCIGNFELLAEKSDLWKNIVAVLEKDQAIGPSLQLMCQNHPGVSNVITSDKDFDSVPEGGCTRSCEYRLSCGHVCSLICHPYDQEHENIRCLKPCPQKCSEGHPCKRKCFQECGICKEKVDHLVEQCRHTIKVNCGERNNAFECTEPCKRILRCGHQCKNKCSDSCVLKCQYPVAVISPVCSHKVEVKCFETHNLEHLTIPCKQKCGAVLPCGHICKGTCSKCHQGRLHMICNQKCKRILVCGHECKSPCSKSCPPCKNTCQNRCFHSKCPKKCGEPCQPCNEKCKWECKHLKCERLCGELCNRGPCNQPCPSELPCGHPCIGFCGEPCPKECRICDEEKVKEIFFGSEDEPEARFMHLEDCNHFFEVEGLTQWMQTASAEIQMKACPRCKTVIRRNLRFESIVKSCLQDIEKVKRVTYGDPKGNMLRQAELLEKVKRETALSCNPLFRPFVKTLLSGKKRSIQDITVMENIVNVTISLLKAIECLPRKIGDPHDSDDSLDLLGYSQAEYSDANVRKEMGRLASFVHETAAWLCGFALDEFLTASEMQLQDATWEVHRVKLAGSLFGFMDEHRDRVRPNAEFSAVVACLVTSTPFRDEHARHFTTLFEAFVRSVIGAVIIMSGLEKENILKAMGLAQGHWYQCPNGHVYCITECGGAMQQARCNECGEQIGGGGHQLLSTNQVGTAMDGSRHGAWSEAMNMGNYNLD